MSFLGLLPGCVQVHFGDLPASISGRRLANGVIKGVGLRLAGALTLTAGIIAGNVTHQLPGEMGVPHGVRDDLSSPALWLAQPFKTY